MDAISLHQCFLSQDLYRAAVQKAFGYASRLGAQLGNNDVPRLDPLSSCYDFTVQLAVRSALRLAPLAEETILSIWCEQDDKTKDDRNGYRTK